MRDAVGDVLALLLAGATAPRLGLGHPLLPHDLLLVGHGALRALAGPGVGVGSLAPHRQALAVPDALVRADLDLALDVLRDVTPQVALDPEVGIDVAYGCG